MNKKQTEILREYLGICGRLWRWIGKNAKVEEYIGDTKSRWREWKRNGGTVQDMINDCPCCEFTDVLEKGCDCCPLEWAGRDCCSAQSEYNKACVATTQRSQRMWANRIARLAEEALARLEAQ